MTLNTAVNNEENKVITLKKTGYGTRIIVEENALDVKVMDKLNSISNETFADGGVMIDLQSRECNGKFICDLLYEITWKRKLRILSWNSYHGETIDCLKLSGLPTGEIPEAKKEDDSEKLPTLALHRSLRSGQKIEHAGDVVVFGHVNSGSEVIAKGSVSIFGKLKGLVHAGFNAKEDDEMAYIYTNSFEPQQIRLGGLMNTKIGPQMRCWAKSVLILSENGSLIVREL